MESVAYEVEENQDNYEFASRREVESWDSEVEAFEYALKVARKKNGRLSARDIAYALRWSNANMTKIRQEMAGFPRESSKAITEQTKCYALQQYRNHLHGFVSKTIEEEEADQAKLRALRQENDRLERELREAEDEFLELRKELRG